MLNYNNFVSSIESLIMLKPTVCYVNIWKWCVWFRCSRRVNMIFFNKLLNDAQVGHPLRGYLLFKVHSPDQAHQVRELSSFLNWFLSLLSQAFRDLFHNIFVQKLLGPDLLCDCLNLLFQVLTREVESSLLLLELVGKLWEIDCLHVAAFQWFLWF